MVTDERIGALLSDGSGGGPLVWFPRGMLVGRKDQHGRITAKDSDAVESWWELNDTPTLHLRLSDSEGAEVFWPMAIFTNESGVAGSDLSRLTEVEQRRVVKSDWFDASSSADLWKYLLDGSLYDPRDEGYGRFRCQQCALAWWRYLMALRQETGKPHFRALARAVAWTVHVDLADDGSWRHGFWRAEPEVHARFLWDGVRLLLAEHEASRDDEMLTSAERAAKFALENLSETLHQKHLWFLHDSLEGEGRRVMKPSLLGRSAGNSLCLNTHVQALSVLKQLTRLKPQAVVLADAYDRGFETLHVILGMAGGGAVFRLIDRWLPSLLDWKVPHGFRQRVLRFVAYRVFVGALWKIRRGAPRLVFPSGYLDRDLGATLLADEYHVVNLKELIGLYRDEPRPWLRSVIDDAYSFAASLDFSRALERHPIWAEWFDVVGEWASMAELRVNGEAVESSVRESLGGSSLDAFCRRYGVEIGGAEDGEGRSAP